MKNIGKLAVLGAVLAASSSFALADTVTLGSYGSTAGYNPGQPTVINTIVQLTGSQTSLVAPITTPPAIVPSAPVSAFNLDPGTPVWAPALANSIWVGPTVNSGPIGTVNPAYGYYQFTTTFNLIGTYAGILNVLADDTTSVTLTNSGGTTTLIAMGALLADGHCAGGIPNCLITDSVAMTGLAGLNTLTFILDQAGVGPPGASGDPTGIDFNATLASTAAPEPNSLVLLGTGLVSAAGMLLRRRRLTT